MNKIDGKTLRNMIVSSANNLQKNKTLLNDLNVFPVPDGDTGTNMALTILAVAKAINDIKENTVSNVSKIASNGALRGARGNSGVILSQLFRGLYQGLEGVETAKVEDVANALMEASNVAYKAVMKPKEGTILTVARGIGEKAIEIKDDYNDIKEFLQEVYKYGEKVLDTTPEMLPVLKEAGVVDAGGKGYLCILEGFIQGIDKKDVSIEVNETKEQSKVDKSNISTADIKFGYCTEFIIENKKLDKKKVKPFNDFLNKSGDSIVLVADDDLVKVHIHTNNPGRVLDEAIKLGSLVNIKIDNMRYEHQSLVISEKEKQKNKKPEKDLAFIAVAAGDGLSEVMTELDIDYVITGGQTMNPSTDDILEAIEEVNAKEIIIMPNNKNIILAAEQAAKISDKKVYVVKTTSFPQAVTAMVEFNPTLSGKENSDRMSKVLNNVKTIEVTYAVRDTKIDNKSIKKDDTLVILDGKIVETGKSKEKSIYKVLDKVLDEDSELVSIYYGEGSNDSEANKISDYIENKFEDCEVEIREGKQPVYSYIISVE